MEDLELSTKQLKQINACCMYLKITTLTKMVDNTSHQLLPQVLTSHQQHHPAGLDAIIQSMVEWPYIHCPSQTSWCFWMTTICNRFAGTAQNTRLTHLLSAWTSKYQTNHFWKWQLSPTQQLLHQQAPTCHPKAAILLHNQRTQLQFSPSIPTNQKFKGFPVTPFNMYHQIVWLPVPHILPSQDPSPTNTVSTLLTAQFCSTLKTQQCPLFGPIQKLQSTSCLLHLNQAGCTISLVSNSSVQKDKHSSFAWVLSTDASTLWKGVGLAPGNADNMYSGQAEAFGLLAGLTFLQYYISCYTPERFTPSMLYCFCNNLGVITNITEMLTTPTLHLNDTTNDNHDIYKAIGKMLKQCSPSNHNSFMLKVTKIKTQNDN